MHVYFKQMFTREGSEGGEHFSVVDDGEDWGDELEGVQ